MKKILFSLFISLSTIAFSQVGVNTTTPEATLDVVGIPTNASRLDGIIPPRITGDQLRAKTYTNSQVGAIVYVTTPDTNPSGQTLQVRDTGYYYFNGNLWVKFLDSGYVGHFIDFTGANTPVVLANYLVFNDYDTSIYEVTFHVRPACNGNNTIISGKFLIRGKGGRMTVLNDYMATYGTISDTNIFTSDYTITGNNTNSLYIDPGASISPLRVDLLFKVNPLTGILTLESPLTHGCAGWKAVIDVKKILM
ncbi:hypothetical protein SAMN05880574_1612 [Chryseobacterium sp. RU37D]|uniref:hypothetical protein n=1 Tax=Chryseobacterium sp. RU37D TaxID=1907397 RepID=UPI000954F833|nr:hypothetical protein [Chryseobacterium sp. RU37D]SIR03449.1 hypothetical protein SAMN05880574_1612 [Chryseobacterium sp. RU37D]